ERFAELVDNARPTQIREWIVRGPRRNERTVGQLVCRTMVVGNDDVEPELAGAADLLYRRDAAVHRENDPTSFSGKPLERLAADPVALVEAARQVPVDLRAQLAEDEDRKHCRADAVHVVVAVDADATASADRRADALDRRIHVSEQEGVVQRLLTGQKGPRLFGVAVAAPDEHACRDLAEAERFCEGARLPVRARTDSPDALRHARLPYERCRTAPTSGTSSCSTRM